MNGSGHNLCVEAQRGGYSQTSTGDFSLAFMGGLKHALVELHSFYDRIADCQQVLVENGR